MWGQSSKTRLSIWVSNMFGSSCAMEGSVLNLADDAPQAFTAGPVTKSPAQSIVSDHRHLPWQPASCDGRFASCSAAHRSLRHRAFTRCITRKPGDAPCVFDQTRSQRRPTPSSAATADVDMPSACKRAVRTSQMCTYVLCMAGTACTPPHTRLPPPSPGPTRIMASTHPCPARCMPR